MAAERPASDAVHVDGVALARVTPELVEVLHTLHAVTTRMSSMFTTLSAEPSRYGTVREDLERLDGERRGLLERLGDFASKVLVLREATESFEGSEGVASPAEVAPKAVPEVPLEDGTGGDIPENDMASPVELEDRPGGHDDALHAATGVVPGEEKEADLEGETAPAPLSQTGLVAALRASKSQEQTQRPTTNGDKATLLSLAQHVNIADTTPALLDEIAALERATADARIPQWKKMSASAQVRWLTILVAWAKALEQEAREGGEGEAEARVGTAFRRLRAFSMHDRPGFIVGFARSAMPQSETWRADAAEMLGGLRARSRDATTPRPTTVVVYDEVDVDDERESKVPEDWPHFSRVRGKNVVMVGGEVREERRVALEEAFQCASLTWVPHNRPRLLQSLGERAAQGNVEIILVNKFVAHKETEALERAATVPIIGVRRGYGVTAVKTALEEYFGRRAASGA